MIRKQSTLGFTLIEILLALMIFAMLGIATYSVLNTSIQSRDTVVVQNDQLQKLTRALATIERDIVQFAQRRTRVDGEPPSEIFFSQGDGLLDSDGQGFSFVRDGWFNPLLVLPRSELQSVAYRIKDGVLERLYFNFVDHSFTEEPRVQKILSGVNGLSVNLAGQSESNFNASTEPPTKLEIVIETELFGAISRRFPLVSQVADNEPEQVPNATN